MGFLRWIGQALAPILLEHGAPLVRNWWKARAGQNKPKADEFQQIARDLELLREHAAKVDSDLDALNNAFTAREEKLRRWVLTLLIWNTSLTLGLVLLAVVALRH